MRIHCPLALAFSVSAYAGSSTVSALSHSQTRSDTSEALQDIVTWDAKSLFIHGERVMIWSGEVHPFRLPSPSLHLDVFQKIKAMGFNMVSFYVDWALLEGKRGEFRSEGVFDLQPFLDAAKTAGVYLLARPGPYINAEASGGGFPGWLQRVKGKVRTNATDYLNATNNYMANIGAILAKAQVVHGGPLILWQPENEYSWGDNTVFPNKPYMQYVEDQARNAGIVVPLLLNDEWAAGNFLPGSGEGAVDIYGFDSYPLGFDCRNPSVWPQGWLPTNLAELHEKFSPGGPFALVEFQGGSFDSFSGPGFDSCYQLLNHEFARVFYKNNIASGVRILNLYMTFGGTNWGNLGYDYGYTSYDYAAAITEDRLVIREKYSELKLEAQFMKVSPGYLETKAGSVTSGVYSESTDVGITALLGNGTGSFFVIRHADYSTTTPTAYTIKLPTSQGNVTIPQIGEARLTLPGRDSKIHVTDYPVGSGHKLVYSTGEVFTWKEFSHQTVLLLYGGSGELHELSVTHAESTSSEDPQLQNLEGASGVKVKVDGHAVVVQWVAAPQRQVVQIGTLVIYLLDRNSAYRYWVPVLPGDGAMPTVGSSVMNPKAVIVNGGYLIRSAAIDGSTLSIKADFNDTASLEVIGVPRGVSRLRINGKEVDYVTSALGNWIAKPDIAFPKLNLPDLLALDWHKVDSLPEIQANYDDSAWTSANHTTTLNPRWPLVSPVSLYGSDYGYDYGALVFRGHFKSNGLETALTLWTQGGGGYASSVWLNNTFLGTYKGDPNTDNMNQTYALSGLTIGKPYVLTVIVDNMGLDETTAGDDDNKRPRGILNFSLTRAAGDTTVVSPWKIAGNFGGEDYVDKFRGPLNEGGFYFERKGFHLPSPPLHEFDKGSPANGTSKAGVTFYTAKLDLELPSAEYDTPLSIGFSSHAQNTPLRALLYVNGFQFGRYINYWGPQTKFHIPEGILNHSGENWIGVAIWALEEAGASFQGMSLEANGIIATGREPVAVVNGPAYSPRHEAS